MADPDPLAALQSKAAQDRGQRQAEPEVEQPPPPSDKHSLCLEILTSGHVQSFVDFFYLTHKAEAPLDGDAEREDDHLVLVPEQLEFVKESLTQAERARRQGQTKEVYTSYQRLAELFGESDDNRTSIYFREKCLEIAKLVGDAEGELIAGRELGVAHEKLGNVAESIKFYERAHQLAKAEPPEADHEAASIGAQANRDLVQAYLAQARECEAQEDYQQALVYHEKCVMSAVESQDQQLVGTAHYHLGQCLEHVRDSSQAIDHYKQYLELCRETGDTEGQGAAAFALASAYQQTGDTTSAVTHLEQFIDLAQGTGQVRSQAEACNSLGIIHNKQGDARSAVHYFERFYELARSLGDRPLVDKARTHLGIARGNLVMGSYIQVVTTDLNSLLKWKNRRVPFAEVAPRK